MRIGGPRALAVSRPVAVPVRAAGSARPGQDATLADGVAATNPTAWTTVLIRLVASTQVAEGRVAAARRAFEEGRQGKGELHAAEAELDVAYDRLRTLKGAAKASWRVGGFDLDAVWARHGMPLPEVPRRRRDLANWADRHVGQAVSLVGTGAIAAFFLFARTPQISVICFAVVFVSAAIMLGLRLIATTDRR